MAFPDADRLKTFTFGASPVDSNVLNPIQDAIINLWAGCHGEQVLGVNLASGQFQGGSGTYNVGVELDAASTYHRSLDLPEGARIVGIKVKYERNDGSTMQFGLRKTDGAGASTLLAQKDVSAGAGDGETDIETATSTGSLPQTLGSEETFVLSLKGGAGAGNKVWSVHVTVDHPP